MSKQDYYETLSVSRSASASELKKAYRSLAMKFHPDRNPDDPEAEKKFKNINEAYDVLKDAQKRAAYDRYGHAAFENGGGRPGGFDFGAGGGFADIFEEMFGDVMGGRRGRRASGRGGDMRFNLDITLEEAFKGKQATIRVPSSVSCEGCGGSGAAGGTQPVGCRTCGGVGKVRTQQGFFTIERTCPSCGGVGQVITDPCRQCSGSGRVRKDRSLQVSIPAGVEDGTRIRLAGEGEAGLHGAPPGDLYIFLAVRAHPLFQRDGADVYCKVPIPMVRAALGGPVEVPVVDGSRAEVAIPGGAQSGNQFRLRGKGMSILHSKARGDMYVQVQVETPVSLNRRQRELLEEFQEQGGEKTHPESHGFFARAREFFENLKE
ncbi:MAG: molecular chaperone DnaJ [Inquilinus sp.]|nr:molecular chaperone DnaJ [Inquilinus sp.]